VVGETTFQADAMDGIQQVTAMGSADFVAIELTAGAYDDGNFVFGAYGDGEGGFGSPITTDSAGRAHGSDFLVDWVEFSFAVEPGLSTQAVEPAVTNMAVQPATLIGLPEFNQHDPYAYT
jgi:hypothetical protein